MTERYITQAQETSLRNICARYSISNEDADGIVAKFNDRGQPFGLPEGYVLGWVGTHICIGICPEGRISS